MFQLQFISIKHSPYYLQSNIYFIYMKKININNDIHCVFEGIGGNGNIYISGIKPATDKNIIKDFNIRAIVSATFTTNIDKKLFEIDHYMHIPALDCQEFKISDYFERTFDFIQQARKSTNVLVHCQAGISRSSTIVLAYLMKKYKYSCDQLLALLKRKRKQINPNRGFIRQLQEYEQKLKLQKKKQFKTVISSILRQSRQKEYKRSQSVPLTQKKRQDDNLQKLQDSQKKNNDTINKEACYNIDTSKICNKINLNQKQQKMHQRYHSSFIVCKSIEFKQKYRLKNQQNQNIKENKLPRKIETKIRQSETDYQNTGSQNHDFASINAKIQSKTDQMLLKHSNQNLTQTPSQIGSPSVFNRINISSTSQSNSRFFQNTKDLMSKINRIKDKLARQYEKSRRTQEKRSSQKNDQSKRSSNKWRYLRVSSSPDKESISRANKQSVGGDNQECIRGALIDNNRKQIQVDCAKNICFEIKPCSIQKNKSIRRQ